jgi:hypothetical protein
VPVDGSGRQHRFCGVRIDQRQGKHNDHRLPGQEPSNYSIVAVCTHWAFVAGGAGHDFDLWPECPFGDQVKEPEADAAVVPLRPRPAPALEPVAEPEPMPSQRTQSAPRVRVLDADPPLSKREREMRWGGPAGDW